MNQPTEPPRAAAPTFTNTTSRPVMLATWQRVMEGLSEYRRADVAPGETRALPPSCTDEFIVESERYERVGKFRLSPAASRDFSWMESAEHDITWQTPPGGTRPQEYRLVPAPRPPRSGEPASLFSSPAFPPPTIECDVSNRI